MSSLKVDNITGTGSTGFTGSVKSDGGNTTTDLQQGLAKSWISHSFGSDNSIDDSFNISSTTDNSTADMDITFSNPMNNANYVVLLGQRLITSLNGVYYSYNLTTTKFEVFGRYNSAYYEWSPQRNAVMGDLA